MIQSDKFWDKVAAKYSQQTISDEQSYQRKLSETQSVLNLEMHVLEFGCGTGSTAIQHAPHVKQIDALDVSENMLAIAKEKAQEANISNINFSLGTLQDANADAESIDAVLGLNVIHLIKDRAAVIEEVARILKPGGVFVSSTGCLGNSYLRFIKLLAPIAKLLGLMPDFFIIKEDELAKEIRNAGFTIETQWHHGTQDISVFIIARKLSAE